MRRTAALLSFMVQRAAIWRLIGACLTSMRRAGIMSPVRGSVKPLSFVPQLV